jgi:hypothetical protein
VVFGHTAWSNAHVLQALCAMPNQPANTASITKAMLTNSPQPSGVAHQPRLACSVLAVTLSNSTTSSKGYNIMLVRVQSSKLFSEMERSEGVSIMAPILA